MRNVFRILGRVVRGEDITKVKLNQTEWDRQFRKGNWDFLLGTHQNMTLIISMLEDIQKNRQSPLRVLDVGCGNGALARSLPPAQFVYTGTDISAVAVDSAKVAAPSGTFVVAPMEQPPAFAQKFDVIVFAEVLLYGDYERVLGLYQPYLEPKGQLIISLYDTWRTRIIWFRIKRFIVPSTTLFVRNVTRRVAWTVKLCQYRNS